MSDKNIFSRIASREIPSNIILETARVIAFEDIAPKAPVHIIITTKNHSYENVVKLAEVNPELLAEMIKVAKQIADRLCNGQFRLIFNTGRQAGQTIFQVHAHLLGSDSNSELTESSIAN